MNKFDVPPRDFVELTEDQRAGNVDAIESQDFIPRGSRKENWGTLANEKVTISSLPDWSAPDSFTPLEKSFSFYMNHENSSKRKLYSFMKDEKYIDVRLKLDDGTEFPCNRCILASKSPYFDCLLSGGMRESKADVVPVVGVSPSRTPTSYTTAAVPPSSPDSFTTKRNSRHCNSKPPLPWTLPPKARWARP